MSVMLFKLRGVEEDEADEIRSLLGEHDIEFYETSNGRWGLGFAAIWLHDAALFEQAKALIDRYQQERFIKAREAYAQSCEEEGEQTLLHRFLERPVQVSLIFAAILFMVFLAVGPFIYLK